MSTQSPHKIAAALFCVFLPFYLLIFGGHTYSLDEEVLYYVTEGIVERGSPALPPNNPDLPIGSSPTGVDGKTYAITGLAQSVLAIPLYLVGRTIANLFPAPFHDYWTRFFVCTLNSFVTSAMVAAFYLFARRLGFRQKTSLYLTISLGLATILAVYARTFYTESLLTFWLLLAAGAAFLYKIESQARWASVMGLALGLAAATKIAALIVLPAFGLYLVLAWLRQPGQRRGAWTWRGLAATALGFAPPMLMVIIYNYVRFHSLFETGYHITTETLTQTQSSLMVLYAFLFSSGRGIFAYSPPLILVVWSVGAALRRIRDETVLFLGICVVHLVFYANFRYWWGGGCWGPRYMVYITPFALLLCGALLEKTDIPRWVRVLGAVSLLAAGLAVNFSTLMVDYRRYVIWTEPFEHQMFYPSASPIVAQWNVWSRQFARLKQMNLDRLDPARPFYTLADGFNDIEAPVLSPFGRWTKGPARLFIYAEPRQAATVHVAFSQSTQPGVPRDPPQFFLNGYRANGVPQSLGRAGESDRWAVDLALPAQWF